MRKILILLAFWALPAMTLAACFDVSKSEPAELTGVLSLRVFPGPPNYEDVNKGDTPETVYVLILPEAICLTGDADFTEPSRMFDEVHLVSRDTTAAAMRAMKGTAVRVKLSKQMPAHTGHHHRPLVAWVDEITAEEALAPTGRTALATVRAFYAALTVGDGKTAAALVVEEKRRTGPLSAEAISAFYGSLAEPLKLVWIEDFGDGSVTVQYRYAMKSRTCNGVATVTTTERDGDVFISGIAARNGC